MRRKPRVPSSSSSAESGERISSSVRREHELDIVSRRGDGEDLIQPHAGEFRAVADVEGQRLSRRVDQLLLAQQMLDQREAGDEQHIAEYILGNS